MSEYDGKFYPTDPGWPRPDGFGGACSTHGGSMAIPYADLQSKMESEAQRMNAAQGISGQLQGIGQGLQGYAPAPSILSEQQLLAMRILANAPKPDSLQAQMMSAAWRETFERCAAIVAKI